MADKTFSSALVGCTGLVGSHILSTLVSVPAFSTVHAISRRGLPADLTKSSSLSPHMSTDNESWPSLLSSAAPAPIALFSALGTTRGQAGSFAAQRKIDYDLDLAMAEAAKNAGASTYVLISSSGSDANSFFGYTRMKGELEDAVQELGFKHTVILRPGLLVGQREDSRPPEAFLRKIANVAGGVNNSLKDFWAQDAEVVARAAVSAGRQCAEGKRKEGVWIVGQAEIVKLGRTEWSEGR